LGTTLAITRNETTSLHLIAAMPLQDNDLPEGSLLATVDPSLCAFRHPHSGVFHFTGFHLLVHHSCRPNLVYKYQQELDNDNWRGVYACRDIAEGEPLTMDFNTAMWERTPAPCLCLSENCRGTVGGFSQLTLSEQEQLKAMDWKRQPTDNTRKQGQALSPYIRTQLQMDH
jgi:SET domain